jgi:hypothetical protein
VCTDRQGAPKVNGVPNSGYLTVVSQYIFSPGDKEGREEEQKEGVKNGKRRKGESDRVSKSEGGTEGEREDETNPRGMAWCIDCIWMCATCMLNKRVNSDRSKERNGCAYDYECDTQNKTEKNLPFVFQDEAWRNRRMNNIHIDIYAKRCTLMTSTKCNHLLFLLMTTNYLNLVQPFSRQAAVVIQSGSRSSYPPTYRCTRPCFV